MILRTRARVCVWGIRKEEGGHEGRRKKSIKTNRKCQENLIQDQAVLVVDSRIMLWIFSAHNTSRKHGGISPLLMFIIRRNINHRIVERTRIIKNVL